MKNNIVTLTLHRGGERNSFYRQCKEIISNQTLQPTQSIFVDYPPKGNKPDLVERFKEGLRQLPYDSVVVMIEDDDYYPSDYLEWVDNNFEGDIFGIPETIYYHLPKRKYKYMKHPKRSSLFTTIFRANKVKELKMPQPDLISLDMYLWRNMKGVLKDCPNMPIGMKHGVGLCGGKGHEGYERWNWTEDKWLLFIESKVEEKYWKFYKKIIGG